MTNTVSAMMDPEDDGTDRYIEGWLRRHGVTNFRLRRHVAIDLIDEYWSVNNNVRTERIIPGHPEEFADLYRDNAPVPPLIGFETRKGIRILDGNNRFAGAKMAGVQHLDVYIVDADPATYQRILAATNLRNGRDLSLIERLDQAFIAVKDGGASEAAAAREFGVTVFSLSKKVGQSTVSTRASRLAVKGAGQLPEVTYHLRGVQSDVAFKAACLAAMRRKNLKDKDVKELAALIKEAGSDEAALQVIEDWTAATRSIRKMGATGWSMLARSLGGIKSALDYSDLLTTIPPSERAALRQDIFAVCDRLSELASELA